MIDHFPVEIRIGGRLKKELIPEFAKTIFDNISFSTWNFSNSKDIENFIYKCVALNETVVIQFFQAYYNFIQNIEIFLDKNYISYDKQSDGYLECDAIKLCRRYKTIYCFKSSRLGLELVCAQAVRNKIKGIKDIIAQVNGNPKIYKDKMMDLDKALEEVDRLVPEIPVLEPLLIV